MRFEYYEKTFLKVLPFIVFCLGVISPFVRDYPLATWSLRFLILAFFVIEIYIVLDRRPVLVITNDWVFLKGLRPGFAKLLQLWHGEQIPLGDIIDIRVGKIRERGAFGMKLPPLGEPTSSSHIRKFLWVRYRRDGRQMELYYPHTPLIRNFDDALSHLRQLRTCDLVEYEKT